tara:strand:- start:81 stop:485 length:405 start_codon:yes stop_codon:yes gene_type:complete
MERLNRIFAEWAKDEKRTELASEKVQLGLVDDLKKQKKKLDGLGKKFNKAIDNFNNSLAMARQDYAPVQKEYQNFLNEVEKYDAQGQKYLSAIKELGLNPKDQREYEEGTFKAISGMFGGDFDRATNQMNGIKR